MMRSAAILQGADLANAFMGGRADFAIGTVEDKIVGAKNIGGRREEVRREEAPSRWSSTSTTAATWKASRRPSPAATPLS